MIELVILSVMLVAFLAWASGKGTARLAARHTGVTLPLAGGFAAAVAEALPTQPASPVFTLRTIIAVVAGVFAGRMFGSIAKFWILGQEKRLAADPTARPTRFIHPLIAAGIAVAGIPSLWLLITSNHAFLEEELTPRDAATGIAHGFEAVHLPAEGERAALLLHDLYASPADFGALPAALHARGLEVSAPLLPGHGRMPDDLDRVWREDYVKAALAAYDELAARHATVTVIGSSFGGTLALRVAAERPSARVVLANPFLGRLTTPAWCPVSYETLVGPLSRAVRRRIDAGDGLTKIYFTQSLHAARQAMDLARAVGEPPADFASRATVLVGDADSVLPPAVAAEWAERHGVTTTRLRAAGHAVFVGADAAQAVDAAVAFAVR